MRTGLGFDMHAFDPERSLILGGVTIPGPGLAGHSDADVVTHAVIDAFFGALALGDLGTHFPDDDERWKDASSLALLVAARDLVGERGYVAANIDVTVLLEAPRISQFRDQMRSNLAAAAGLNVDRVSVKATTTEGLGTVGRGEGAAALAVVACRRRWWRASSR